MGFWEDVGAGVTGIYPLKKKLEKQQAARHRIASGGFREDIETLINGMDTLDSVLQGAEYGTYMTEYGEKIADIRQKLGEVKGTLSTALGHYDTLEEVWDFMTAVRAASKFSPGQDPLNEAKAYGAALQSFGKIAGKIPFLSNYALFFEEMGKVFVQTVANIVPHLRGNNQRADEKFKQSEGRSLWD